MFDPVPRVVVDGEDAILINQEFDIHKRKIQAIQTRLTDLEENQDNIQDLEARLEGQEETSLEERKKLEGLIQAFRQQEDVLKHKDEVIDYLQRRITILEDKYIFLSEKLNRTNIAIDKSDSQIANVTNRLESVQHLITSMAHLSLK